MIIMITITSIGFKSICLALLFVVKIIVVAIESTNKENKINPNIDIAN